MAKTFRGRLRADPSLSVGDLMDAFKVQFDEKGTRDIKKVLDPPQDMGWKSAPTPRWLVRLFVLYSKLLDIAPNTLVTSRKLKEALQRLHDAEPIHVLKKDDTDVWDWADTKVRIGLAQLRELKNNYHGSLDRAVSRLPDDERSKLQTLLDKINLGKDVTSAAASSSRTTRSDEDLALVAVLPTPTSADDGDDSQQTAAVLETILGAGRKRVLSSASSSDPKAPDKKMLIKLGHSNKSSTRRTLSFHDHDGDDSESDDDDSDDSSSSSSSSDSSDDHHGTKIQILPAGEKLVHKYKKKKRDDKKKKKKQKKKQKKQNKKDKKKEHKKKRDKKRTRDDGDDEEMGGQQVDRDVPVSLFDNLMSLMDDGDTPPRSKKQKMTHMMEEKKTNDKKEKNKKKVKSQSRAHGDDVDVDQEEDIHSLSKASGFCSKY